MFVTSQLKLFGQLVTPSWLSGLVAVVASLALVTTAAVTLHYNGSSLQLLRQTQADSQSVIAQDSNSVNANLTANWFVSDIPLLVLWGAVGWLAYLLVTQTIRAFTNAIDLHSELQYVHANRRQQLQQIFLRFGIRLILLVTWLLYAEFTIHVLVPYIMALADAGSGGLGWLADTTYLLSAMGLTVVCVHLHTVMLRLVLLRPRVFGQAP